jgi:extracellular elastinolytic metalloproteinase
MAGELRSLVAAIAVALLGVLAIAPGVAMALADEPRWRYFKNIPFLDGSGGDRRVVGCFPIGVPQSGCEVNERTTVAAATAPWDTHAASPMPTFTTTGDYADSGLSALSPLAPAPDRTFRPASATRDYLYPFTNAWRSSSCNPSVFASPSADAGGSNTNDINAAVVNVFVAHNHMHDWSFGLGFTPATFNMDGTDPVLGNVQAGAKTAPPTFSGRDAANHTTPADGTSPAYTSYLWQPIAAAYYPQCVDGSFDMSVIAHEYAHAIANRMVGGPTAGLTSSADGQARAIGEGFADAAAVEYLHEHGYAPADDEGAFTLGAYISGNRTRGVRNYSMADSPLNYSNIQGWDGSGGASPADDGEIWAAVNYDIRQALVAAHPADGSRRWIEIAFDALLAMPANATMVQARDAYIAAAAPGDREALWTAFARRGLGAGAASSGTDDPNPVPSFESPERTDESVVTFAPSAAERPGAPAITAQLFVGDHEAGVTPVADTDPATPLDDVVALVPGRYRFVARGAGLGAQRFERDVPAASSVALDVAMPTNRASATNGATASGDGARQQQLIDDTEATNWEAANRSPDVGGAHVTVRLAGGSQRVERVNVSALLSGTDDGDEREDGDNQNRFTALRQFELHTCLAGCDAPDAFTKIYTSPADAFPGGAPRPVTPDLTLRSFDVPDTLATHLRLVVVSNQCTGLPLFNDNSLDSDPSSNSDCTLGNAGGVTPADRTVRAAELQVFSTLPEVETPTLAPAPAPTDPPPSLTAVSMKPNRFRLGRKLPHSSAVRTGTTIRFRLSEAARVTYGFRRALPGRRVGRRCLAPTRARKGRRRCTRYVPSGSISRPAAPGSNLLRFQGRLTRGRALRPGQYRLTLVAIDHAGQRSAPRALAFRLLARRR